MSTTNARRDLAAILGLAGFIALLLAATPAGAAALTERLDSTGTRAFWTEERMDRAIPLDTPRSVLDPTALTAARRAIPPYITGPVDTPTAEPFRAVGKMFFKLGGNVYVCSAAIVKAPSRSLIWTAGHCLRDPGIGGQFASKVAFVPAYDRNERPFGVWSARAVRVPREWGLGNQHFDFGAAILRKNGGQKVERAVDAALPFGPNPKAKQRWTAIGYPQADKFNDDMWSCTSRLYRRDRFRGSGPNPMGIACNMTGGASGGPWLTERGKLGAVSSYIFRRGPDAVYGTYLGGDAKRLYRKMRNRG